MLLRTAFTLFVLSAAATGCVLDWDRLERAANNRDASPTGDLGDATVKGDVAPDGPRCTPASDTCPMGQYCAPSMNDCVPGCRNDMDCAGMGSPDAGSAPLRCEVTTHTCVPCTIDSHCPIGNLCMGNTCVPGCNAARGCPMGRSCCSGGCIDTASNVANCGACGTTCTAANGVPSCVAGACAVASCMPGFGNCDMSAGNGCETDTTTTRMHCGGCGMACPTYPRAASVCMAGTCQMGACEMGFEDCDRNPMNGCEVNTRTDLANCGGCGTACRFEGASATCTNGVCVRGPCLAGRGDCDGDPANGCEINFASDLMHCGRCNAACSLPRATAQCGAAGACTIMRCDTGWGDCDGNMANGCETDLQTSVSHCATCGNVCPTAGGTAACRTGTCVITSCPAGREECDGNMATPCETDLRSNLTNCGACGRACPTRPNSSPFCVDSRCGNTCASNFSDCDGVETTGCETDVRTSMTHCGGCGRLCAPAGGVGACAGGVCTITRCNPGLGDCDSNPLNGCESDVNNSLANCGACGRACSPANGVGTCSAGTCRLTQCTGSFGNCDGSDANGCEVDMATSSLHCGACGLACPTGTTCVVGRCSTPTFAGYAVTTNPPGVNWIDACAAPGRTTALAGADDELFDGDLPFPVTFWGGRNMHYLLSSNGAVGFGTLYYNITAIPSVGPVRSWGAAADRLAPAVYLFGVDLVAGPSGVCVATVGTAPNRTWVAEYLSAELYVSNSGMLNPSAYSFELLAYEANANLDVVYNTPFVTPFGLTPSSPDPILVAVQDYRNRTRVAPYTGSITATTRVRFSPM
jgi:hypothetical protein